jgi:hypothetical protein
MAVIKPIRAPERSTCEVVFAVKNPTTGAAITPATATWTLTDINGTVINSRQDVSITPGTTMTVYLADADLKIVDDTKELELRLLSFEGTYNNGVTTTGVREEFMFEVENLQVTS